MYGVSQSRCSEQHGVKLELKRGRHLGVSGDSYEEVQATLIRYLYWGKVCQPNCFSCKWVNMRLTCFHYSVAPGLLWWRKILSSLKCVLVLQVHTGDPASETVWGPGLPWAQITRAWIVQESGVPEGQNIGWKSDVAGSTEPWCKAEKRSDSNSFFTFHLNHSDLEDGSISLWCNWPQTERLCLASPGYPARLGVQRLALK